MSKFQFPSSIQSRPVYGKLELRYDKDCLMIADAEGAEAILDIVQMAENAKKVLQRTQIIYFPKDTAETYVKKLEALSAHQLFIETNREALLARLRQELATAQMGLQIYLAGTEGLIGQAQSEVLKAGIPHTAIQTEHRGSVARRMQCVHCKGITEDVITSPFVCSHCGLNLFVRDHYSRRLAAFQGVRVDAEDHGNVPDKVELYQ
ncbi:MAG: dimethylamine monooxygenase subunit DmmA family protein [Candidatus Puniceispirillum sp.]